MDKFSKYWGIAVAVGGVLIGVAGWLYNKGAETQNINGRIFDSPEQKVEHVRHVSEVLPPIEQEKRRIYDSIERDKTNQLLKKLDKDSYDIKRHIHHIDSIQLLNADQMYQIKETLNKNNLAN